MTGEKRYSDRAEAEMLKAASFSDWNPSHFLDVAEMTAALAIGYDWLYPKLSETSRRTIRTAILEKGLKPSFGKEHDAILNAPTNWNQVCHCGMAYGALAVAETEPDLARRTIERAVEKYVSRCAITRRTGLSGRIRFTGNTELLSMYCSSALWRMLWDGLRVVRCSRFSGVREIHAYIRSLRSCVRSVIPIAAPTQDCSRLCFGFTENGDASILCNQGWLLQADSRKNHLQDRLPPLLFVWGQERRSTNRPCRKPYIGKAAAIILFF